MPSQRDCVVVREWRDGDEDGIARVLRSRSSSAAAAFDPEGPLAADCVDGDALRRSYDPADGGCFLVAVDESNGVVVGTAGLIVGTQVSYLKSGASVSRASMTGALRRVCVAVGSEESRSHLVGDEILRSLLRRVEERAMTSGATELIALAYPSEIHDADREAVSRSRSGNRACCLRPSASILESLGYQRLPTDLAGVDAAQYGKQLSISATDTTLKDATNLGKSSIVSSESKPNTAMVDAIFGTSIIAALTLCLFGIATFLGLDPLQSAENRGIGSPLSIEELRTMREDEKLQRTDIDGDRNAQQRQWKDLSREELNEEIALMKVIQGDSVRMQ